MKHQGWKPKPQRLWVWAESVCSEYQHFILQLLPQDAATNHSAHTVSTAQTDWDILGKRASGAFCGASKHPKTKQKPKQNQPKTNQPNEAPNLKALFSFWTSSSCFRTCATEACCRCCRHSFFIALAAQICRRKRASFWLATILTPSGGLPNHSSLKNIPKYAKSCKLAARSTHEHHHHQQTKPMLSRAHTASSIFCHPKHQSCKSPYDGSLAYATYAHEKTRLSHITSQAFSS